MTFQKETMTQAIQSTSAVQIVHVTIANIYTAAKDSVRKEGITMDVKEKLVEIMEDLGCNDEYCKDCEFCNDIDGCVHRRKEIIADRLIANGVTVQEWISVKDRLPDNKEHDWVLAQVVEDNGYMHIPKVMEYRQLRNDWFEETYGWLSEHNGLFSVTHWMPLPNPPKGE